MVASNFSLPDDMRFGEAQIISLTAYTIMLLVGLSTNWTFLTLFIPCRKIFQILDFHLGCLLSGFPYHTDPALEEQG